MKTIMSIILIVLATAAQASQPKITETDEGITVEYTGTPGGSSSKPVVPDKSGAQAQVESLTSKIEQLQKEIDGLTTLTGTETPEEVAQKNALAEQKRLQLEAYRAELAQIAGQSPQKAADKPPSRDEPTMKQQIRRQEMKKEIQELRQLRRDSQTAPAQQ
jgi:vacuolar-type H+-ATPase subunit I/STV1